MASQNISDKFEKLYEDSYDEVAKYVVCHCSDIEDVKDIIQNIYLALYKKIDKAEDKRYVMGIAKNKVKDFYRFRYRAKIKEAEDAVLEAVSDDFNLEETIFLKYDAEKVWNHIKSKNVTVAKIFYLYFYSQMTIKDISRELALTESNVKNHLYRNLKELSVYMEREDDKNGNIKGDF